jgi:vanillate O-demethylase monooxygenase subunit
VFLKNCWYCAGWDYEFSQGRDALIARTMAGEPFVLYPKPNGEVVAM